MKIIMHLLIIGIFSSCSNPKLKLNRIPSSEDITISREKLNSMTPKEIIMLLKDIKPGQIVFFETSKKINWTVEQINEVKSFLGDYTPISPVIKTTASIDCTEEKYLSTVDRETKHILQAFQSGYYPLSQCSTYDLDL